MNAFRLDKRLGAAVLVLWLAALACNAIPTTRVDELRTDTQAVTVDSATSARVQIEMGAGELSLRGGADSLMEATFRYNVADWKPQVSYRESGVQGELSVTHQDVGLPVGDKLINEWDIQLSNSIPLNLVIHTGAGVSSLNLSDLSLSRLEIETGAGITTIDLTGSWDQDLSVSIEAGVGEITVRLPSETGVRVNMDTALVGVTADNLIKDDNGYVNRAFGEEAHTLTLDLQAGVGSVKLEVP